MDKLAICLILVAFLFVGTQFCDWAGSAALTLAILHSANVNQKSKNIS